VRGLHPLVLATVLAGCGGPLDPSVLEIHEVERLDISNGRDDTGPPPAAAAFADAPHVPLPDTWSAEQRARAGAAWYRAGIDITSAPVVPWAVYLPRAVMSAAVWVNGVRVGGASGRNVNRPLLAVVPLGTLRAGRNTLDVRLRVTPTYRGVLGPFLIGPETVLRGPFKRRLFWQVQVVEICILLTLVLGGLGLALWIRRRELPGFAENSLGCLLWAVAMLELVVRDPPFSELVWQWLVTSALVAAFAAFAIGARRFLELGRPWLDRALLLVWLAGATALAVALSLGSPRLTDAATSVWALATVAMGIYLLRLLFLIGRRSRAWSLRVLAPFGLAGFFVCAHDVALGLGAAVVPRLVLFPYLGSIMAVWGGWRIIERFVETLDESEALNRDLERRVTERGEEIARGYDRIHRLEREHAIQDERARLMRDIHDGFGGQLTSMLALVEQSDVAPDEVAEALRDALDDMRLVVYSLGPRDTDLIGLLASWRARIERRLERHGLRFEWQVSDLPPLPWLGPREALHVLRIFQEAVSNVVQHAGATTITVRTGARPGTGDRDGVFVEISDDGRGVAPAHRAGDGTGLHNIARRAEELGGAVSINGGGAGTLVVLWLPVATPASFNR